MPATRKVLVMLDEDEAELTYAADMTVKLGDWVEVPVLRRQKTGTVIELDPTGYNGWCRPISRVLKTAEQMAARKDIKF